MNENLNLVEILKDAPKGTKLWSPLCGECEFLYIYYAEGEDYKIPLIHTHTIKEYVSNGWCTNYADFYKDGQLESCNREDGDCMLFPSKDNRDWSTFKVPEKHKHFESYQKVLVKNKFCSKYFWAAALYSHYDTLTNKHYLVGSDWAKDEDIIPYEGNEDKLGKPVECK